MQKTIPVTYIISGVPTQIPTKLSYKWDDEYDCMYDIHIVVEIEGVFYVSNHNRYFESEIKAFQKVLPHHIKIACCETCRHGNYCPYGDYENEIFCFKDKVFEKKFDVCDEFVREGKWQDVKHRARKLLDYCDDYQPIDHDNYYTYNDWGLS